AENHAQALSQYKAHDVSGSGSQRDTHAKFGYAPPGQIGENAVDPDTCQQQSYPSENSEQQQEKSLGGECSSCKLLHGANIVENLIAGGPTYLLPYCLHHTQRRNFCPYC